MDGWMDEGRFGERGMAQRDSEEGDGGGEGVGRTRQIRERKGCYVHFAVICYYNKEETEMKKQVVT